MTINSIIVITTLLTAQHAIAESMDLRHAEPQPVKSELIEPAVINTLATYSDGDSGNEYGAGLKLSGPRIGMVYLMGEVPERLQKGRVVRAVRRRVCRVGRRGWNNTNTHDLHL